MAKYKKKPIIVEAEQWFPYQPVDGVIYPLPDDNGVIGFHEVHGSCGVISTLEGSHIVSPGDWIIIGAMGEKYPCKPDIFEMTYEVVDG